MNFFLGSPQNDQVKHLVNLQDKKYRYEHQQFLVEGTRACKQLLEKYTPIALYMTEDYYKHHEFAQFTELIVGVTDRVMEKICPSKNPSGICAVFAMPTPTDLPKKGPGIICVNMSDPGNLGTIIRTASAMNITEIILVESVDPYNSKVLQATAGCFATVNLYQTTWQQLQNAKLNLCALIVTGGKNPETINFQDMFLVIGNEAHGLSEEQVTQCNESMTIPMPGNAESLNAAIAGAIGMYLMSKKIYSLTK
ncbi:MAG: TrmH family RNA methyltransferase [Candidatus Chromulinivorax sp.]